MGFFDHESGPHSGEGFGFLGNGMHCNRIECSGMKASGYGIINTYPFSYYGMKVDFQECFLSENVVYMMYDKSSILFICFHLK